jgi:hypothetical protein
MSGTYVIGIYTNGIVRSGVGVSEIPPHFDEPGSAPVPTVYVNDCPDQARKGRVPVGSGWVQGIVKASSLADARMKACDVFAHIPEDTGPAEIVVNSGAKTYSEIDGVYVATLNAEQHTMLSSGRMRVCDLHIKDSEIIFVEDLLESYRALKQVMGDILRPICGDADISTEAIREHIADMNHDEIAEWLDDAFLAITSHLD